MTFATTSLYAIPLALMAIGLSLAVSVKRGKTGISILHGDNMELAASIRRFGNFIENTPLGLILLGLLEAAGAGALWLHVCGGLLLASRVLHPFGLDTANAAHPLRIISGIMGKLSALIAVVFFLWTRLA